jgi:hypothetical protein
MLMMTTATCRQCGRIFDVKVWRAATAIFCGRACYANNRRVEARERFFAKVDKTASCWNWTGALSTQGYGRFAPLGSRAVQAHRFSYEMAKGPIPPGLHLDHLCRNTACVNPDHLEAVTPRENIIRAGLVAMRVCRSGRHQLSAEKITANGPAVTCLLCRREASLARARRRGIRTKEEYWASMRGIAPPQLARQ